MEEKTAEEIAKEEAAKAEAAKKAKEEAAKAGAPKAPKAPEAPANDGDDGDCWLTTELKRAGRLTADGLYTGAGIAAGIALVMGAIAGVKALCSKSDDTTQE